MPTLKRNDDGTYNNNAKLREIGICNLPLPTDKSREAIQYRYSVFRSVLRRIHNWESPCGLSFYSKLDHKISFIYPKINNESPILILTSKNLEIHAPSGDYAPPNVAVLSIRAYCYARYKQSRCPAIVVIQYHTQMRCYKVFTVCKHNHSFDCRSPNRWDNVIGEDSDGALTIELMASKFSPRLVGQKKDLSKDPTPWLSSDKNQKQIQSNEPQIKLERV